MDKYYALPYLKKEIVQLKGPIIVFGAGGFIGINLLHTLLLYRKDTYGVSQDLKSNWRFLASGLKDSHLFSCDITDYSQLENLFSQLKPKTIFNLAGYGAYSKQKEFRKIYQTNFNAGIDIIECAKKYGFSSYIYAGSSSEYGVNCEAPLENSDLLPNSHYSVSKVTAFYASKYYGVVEKLPVIHFRLYSAYGPWEEPDRLIPVILAKARHGEYPRLVQSNISRDFIYITDVTGAFIYVASHIRKKLYGEVFNIGTGKKTTIKTLALLVKKIARLKTNPQFGTMLNRSWDLANWYANTNRIRNLGWQAKTNLEEGLKKTILWQKEIGYDIANWNWMR